MVVSKEHGELWERLQGVSDRLTALGEELAELTNLAYEERERQTLEDTLIRSNLIRMRRGNDV